VNPPSSPGAAGRRKSKVKEEVLMPSSQPIEPQPSSGPANEGKDPAMTGEHPFGDTGQLVCLTVFLILWILDSFVFRLTTFPALHVPLIVRLALAALVLVLGLFFIQGGHRAVPHENPGEPHLIKDGAFSRVRHPLYLGSVLFFLSLVLTTFSLIALAAFLGIFLFYNSIAAYEEKWLLDRHGQAYRDYMRRVPRWLPRVRPPR
jgi:protein-S-isoprenylcysteine O-methyltransferase Ste14